MSEGFVLGVSERIGWYVYLLIDPRDGAVFYIGKGTGQRCFAHLAEARATTADTVGEYEKLVRIRAIESGGGEIGFQLLRHGLDEDQAFLLESACIDLLDLDRLTNRVAGHGAAARGRMSAAHVNAAYEARPVDLDPSHTLVLVRINRTYRRGMPDAEIYEATRKWWKIAAWRRDLAVPGAPRWALGVADGIVRGVYLIECWVEPNADDLTLDPRAAGRWGFVGRPDPELAARYLRGDVTRYLGSQSPLRFVR